MEGRQTPPSLSGRLVVEGSPSTMSIAYSEPPLRLVLNEEAPAYDGQRKSASFVMIPTDVGTTIMGTLGVSAFGVYWHLARRAKDGKCWPSLDDIAEGTMLSRKHVTRMLDALEEGGWVIRTRRTNNFKMATSTMYELPHLSRTYGCDITETSLGHDTPRNVTVTRSITRVEPDYREPPLSPSGGTEKKPRTRGTKTPVPDDLYTLIPEDVFEKIRVEQGMTQPELLRETENMRDHYAAKGERMIDWVACWRKWMRSPYRKPAQNASPGAVPYRKFTRAEEDAERLARGLDHIDPSGKLIRAPKPIGGYPQ